MKRLENTPEGWFPLVARGAQWLPDELGTPALAEGIDKTPFHPGEVKMGQDVPVPKLKSTPRQPCHNKGLTLSVLKSL